MCMHEYVCMSTLGYVCICVYVCVCMRMLIFICMKVYAYVYTYMSMCVCVCIYLCVCISMCAYVFVWESEDVSLYTRYPDDVPDNETLEEKKETSALVYLFNNIIFDSLVNV